MTESRTKNTKRNIVVSMVYTLLTMAFQFVSRSVINHYLGEQYLGLSSLFTAVLQVLNMAELGFSGAIVYNMYKPLANGDTPAVCALLAYYKKIYRTIGMIVLAAGAIATPFVPFLIKDIYPSDINIYVLFALYLANTSVSYFLFAYKTSLLEAAQRMDLVKLAYSVVIIIQYTLQILALVVFRNYYLFVVFMVLGTAMKNVAVAALANKYFPQYVCRGEISDSVKQGIISRVKGLLVCNISSVTYTTVDSIILSAFIGLASVAVYNNYITVMTGVSSFVVLVRTAMQASVGNSVARETVEKNYDDMLLWQFLFSMIAMWCVTCMLSLYQPFMELWMGGDLLLSMKDVALICAWFNVSVIQHSYFLYLSANGLWWELRGPYIGSTVFNLTFNVILGRMWGVTGVILASLLSSVLFGFIWQCNVIFRQYFRRTPGEFYLKQTVYFFTSALSALAAWWICGRVGLGGIPGMAVRLVICSAVTLTVSMVYVKTPMFHRAWQFIKKAARA